MMELDLKVRRVLKIFLVCFIGILSKVWHLEVIQKGEKQQEAQRPRERTVLVRANRGEVFDRFQIPLALNQTSYQVAIYYSEIAQIPSIKWQEKKKIYPRRKYIEKLSRAIGKVIEMDPERIEDLIHSKAAIFPHVPFVIHTSLTEREYAQLKMLEKDFPGLSAEIGSKRFYPQEKTACHLMGTMGQINQKEYRSIAQEIKELEVASFFSEDVDLFRLEELKQKAYRLDDFVGKTGVEAFFEEDLRGSCGKKHFEVDPKGRFLREIAFQKPKAGKELHLSISSDLQAFAEALLIESEKTREGKSRKYDSKEGKRVSQKQPWIKGGAIVAMNPKNGEILALASCPRFDPNDFASPLEKKTGVEKWLESPSWIGKIWDGIEVLEKEKEKRKLSWTFFLDEILSSDSPVRHFFQKRLTIKDAIVLQEDYEAFCYFQKKEMKVPQDIQKRLEATQLKDLNLSFAADLCRICVYAPAFSDALIEKYGSMTLSNYRELSQEFFRKEALLKPQIFKEFSQKEFKAWREENQKAYLLSKRKEEKEEGLFEKPYIDYLDAKEKELFQEYWNEKKWTVLEEEKIPEDLARTFRSFSELKRPLLASYPHLNKKGAFLEKDLASLFYPKEGFGFTRAYTHESPVPLGSVFKIVTAYEALRQKKHFTFVDEWSEKGVGYHLNGSIYPRRYKGGRLPRSSHKSIGKTDLLTAIERSSNPYFSILVSDYLEDPEDLIRAAAEFGFGEKTNIELPLEASGFLPDDLKVNRNGLYAAAIGQHTLLVTPLQTAKMLSILANGGKKITPTLVQQSEEIASTQSVSMDPKVQKTLFQAMDRVVSGVQGSARASAIRSLLHHPIRLKEYLSLKHEMIGKTGTAEIVYRPFQDPMSRAEVYKYTWFGAICFSDPKQVDPELVVVVFLRFGDYGKEAAPLAAQILHKWREIKKKYEVNTKREK